MILYGFFYNGMIHESSAALTSLHFSKAGAWRAMRTFMQQMALDERNFAIQFGGKHMMRRKPLEWQHFQVQAVDVLP